MIRNLLQTSITKSLSLLAAVLVLTASIAYAGTHFQSVAPDKKKACSGSSPCITENNTGSGSAILGMSLSGTTIEANATSGTALYGSSTGTSSSTVGTNSSTGTGVYGYSKEGYGVNGQSHGSDAIEGYSALSDGVYGQSGYNGGTGVYGYSAAGGDGVTGESNGIGAFALGDGAGSLAFLVVGGTANTGTPDVIQAFNAGDSESLTFDDSGNLTITGLLYTNGSCKNGCSETRHVASYAAQTSLPTLDDVGEATLQSGRAYVRFERDFANAVDAARGYLVLLTPEGDSRGLYVARKWTNGFEVRENEGGRSSLAFAYRIVAQPYGKTRQRLPFTEAPKPVLRLKRR